MPEWAGAVGKRIQRERKYFVRYEKWTSKGAPCLPHPCGTVKQLLPGPGRSCEGGLRYKTPCFLAWSGAEVCIQRQILGDFVPRRLAGMIGRRYATPTTKSQRKTAAATGPAAHQQSRFRGYEAAPWRSCCAPRSRLIWDDGPCITFDNCLRWRWVPSRMLVRRDKPAWSRG